MTEFHQLVSERDQKRNGNVIRLSLLTVSLGPNFGDGGFSYISIVVDL